MGTKLRLIGSLGKAVLAGCLRCTATKIYYIVTDHLNTPRRLVDSANHAIVWSWDSTAFGLGNPTGSITFNLRFPGQYYDVGTNQFYNHNRYYNPELGRYMEADPIGLEGGLNPYAYAGSNPVMNVDPSGLCTLDSHCSGSWSTPTYNFDLQNQSWNAIQNQFNFGSGAFNVDPAAFNLDLSIDIGKQLQQSALNSSGYFNKVLGGLESGQSASFTKQNIGFNSNYLDALAFGSGAIGRVSANLDATVTKGSFHMYQVKGTLNFNSDMYSWKPDGTGSLLKAFAQNTMINIGGSFTNTNPVTGAQKLWREASPAYNATGGEMPINYGRAYNFTAWGFYR